MEKYEIWGDEVNKQDRKKEEMAVRGIKEMESKEAKTAKRIRNEASDCPRD